MVPCSSAQTDTNVGNFDIQCASACQVDCPEFRKYGRVSVSTYRVALPCALVGSAEASSGPLLINHALLDTRPRRIPSCRRLGRWRRARFTVIVSIPTWNRPITCMPYRSLLTTEQYYGHESNADDDAAFEGNHHSHSIIRPKFKTGTTIPVAALQQLCNYSSGLVDSIPPKLLRDE